jgi:hypothetical protein
MKAKFTFTFLLLTAFTLRGFSLNIEWLVKKATPTQSKGLFCDKDGNIYQYGSNFPEDQNPYSSFWAPALADAEGSFLQKHTANGQHVFTKRWQNAHFFITKLIYDGSQAFYFAGLFAGEANIDGIQLFSAGDADAMVGKMDLNGNVQWIKTMGSPGGEFAEGLCFDANKTSLVVTGGYTRQLFYNGTLVQSGQQSAFMLQVDVNGNYIRHRSFDFLGQRDEEYDGNWGREVVFSKGNYYWLCDRQGRYWNGDSIIAPEHGRYLIKLNDTFDTLWSRYITGPSCYYGFTCKNLAVSAIGAVYLTRFCAGKYGGIGYLQRYDPVTGVMMWSEQRKDADWEDIAAGGNDLYTVGTVDANAAPGPDSYVGNQLVKNYDALNQGLDSLKIMGPNVWLTDITPDGHGNSFVAGRVYRRAVINGQVIAADTAHGETYAYFLAKVGQGTMGLEPNLVTQVNLFPNPAQESITLEVSKDMIGARITVFDVVGKKVLQRTCDKTTTSVDLSSCGSGVYTVEVARDEKKFVKKVVVE